jgi:hypothetical protein
LSTCVCEPDVPAAAAADELDELDATTWLDVGDGDGLRADSHTRRFWIRELIALKMFSASFKWAYKWAATFHVNKMKSSQCIQNYCKSTL